MRSCRVRWRADAVVQNMMESRCGGAQYDGEPMRWCTIWWRADAVVHNMMESRCSRAEYDGEPMRSCKIWRVDAVVQNMQSRCGQKGQIDNWQIRLPVTLNFKHHNQKIKPIFMAKLRKLTYHYNRQMLRIQLDCPHLILNPFHPRHHKH